MTDETIPLMTQAEIDAIRAAITACESITSRLSFLSTRRAEGLIYGMADMLGDSLFGLLNSAKHFAGVTDAGKDLVR